jgi:hypothetical protein
VTSHRKALVAVGLLLTVVVVQAAASAAARRHTFSNHGISFAYPAAWHATSKPLSNGAEPVYRFSVGNFRFHRTARDLGPCLLGIARQRPKRGVLAFMREALGADARRARSAPRPKNIRLPQRSDQAACLGSGTSEIIFHQAGRVFYLWISVAPDASRHNRRRLHTLLNSMKIKPKS